MHLVQQVSLNTIFFLSKDLDYISKNEYEELSNLENQVAKMLQGLIKALETKV